jgi:RNA polymerase sigma-70 factor (ECF subfamily)
MAVEPVMGSQAGPRDAAEVESLVIRVADDLYRRALRNMQGDRGAAEDLVQEVFHAAVRSWGAIRERSVDEQRAWLFAVLRNKFVDHSRARQRLEPAGDLPGVDHAADDVDQVALANIVIERCWKVIKRMPPVRHRVAVLRWGEGWTVKEIGAGLGMTASTVRGHLKRARDQLAAEVGPDLVVMDDARHGPDSGREEER